VSTGESAFPSALVISLDFELHWGVSERVQGQDHAYAVNLYGARKAVPRLLELFKQLDIHATWATVGKLFARDREDLQAFAPAVRPEYVRIDVDTYRVQTGSSEEEDPLHFAPSLIEQIHDTPGQELACHTFCHYYCDEPGQTPSAFQADLKAAQTIMRRENIEPRSLIFPRNQIIPAYLAKVKEAGLDVYRGNPPGGMYRLPASGPARYAVRALRLLDSFVNLTGHHTVPWSHIAAEDPKNVRASHFLRPYSHKLRFLEPLRKYRVKAGLRSAARRGEVYHLWWHPHNLGANLEKNLAALEDFLDEFRRLRETHGMLSLTMAEAADKADQIAYTQNQAEGSTKRI
jgi:peptidoglycan/xylan/chitin deacetylase (PgdA/CDA1 family)